MPKPLPTLAVPDNVRLDDISWNPNWAEAEWDKQAAAKAKYEKEWLLESIKRLSAIALEIEEEKRIANLIAEQDRVDVEIRAWWQAERAREEAAWKAQQLAKLEQIGKEIRRDAAQLERAELERRGVIRGRRH
jgi:hypothetical protein